MKELKKVGKRRRVHSIQNVGRHFVVRGRMLATAVVANEIEFAESPNVDLLVGASTTPAYHRHENADLVQRVYQLEKTIMVLKQELEEIKELPKMEEMNGMQESARNAALSLAYHRDREALEAALVELPKGMWMDLGIVTLEAGLPRHRVTEILTPLIDQGLIEMNAENMVRIKKGKFGY